MLHPSSVQSSPAGLWAALEERKDARVAVKTRLSAAVLRLVCRGLRVEGWGSRATMSRERSVMSGMEPRWESRGIGPGRPAAVRASWRCAEGTLEDREDIGILSSGMGPARPAGSRACRRADAGGTLELREDMGTLSSGIGPARPAGEGMATALEANAEAARARRRGLRCIVSGYQVQ